MAPIDLAKLGLTKESSFEDIQNKLNESEYFSKEERDSAAAAARKAALAEAQKKGTVLSDEELKEYKGYKADKKLASILDNEIIKKINKKDRDLVINSYKLLELDGDDLQKAIDTISEKESERFDNGLPKKIESDEEGNDKSDDDFYEDF